MDIIECKSKLEGITSDIICSYLELEKHNTLLKQKNIQEIEEINKRLVSMCTLVKEKEGIISSLQQQIDGLNEREVELTRTIDNLRKEVEAKSTLSVNMSSDISTDTEDNSSKFDMIRSQAKEISCKDKEIMHLTKELEKQKELNKIKENIKLQVDDKTHVIGWSPTSNSDPKLEVEKLDLGELNEKDNEDLSEEVEEELYIVKYGRPKKEYYRDKENNVFTILDNDEKGPKIGQWIKQTNGKSKLVKD